VNIGDDILPKSLTKSAEYVPVQIPKSLLKKVDEIVGKLGYRSRSEFVKEAIRALLREYGVKLEEE